MRHHNHYGERSIHLGHMDRVRWNVTKMLGMGKKGDQDTSAVTNAARPVSSLTQIPIGASLNDIILKGLSGQGWGFDPSFVSRTTSPVAAQREATWKEQTAPGISAEMSSRGLGRSTIAGDVLAKAAGAKDRDINELIAQAYAANEQQKKADEARFQGLGQWYTGAEANAKAAYAADDVNRMKYALYRQFQLGDTAQAQKQDDINQMIGLGTSFINPAGSATSGVTSGMTDLMGELGKMTQAKNATPAVSAPSPFNVNPLGNEFRYKKNLDYFAKSPNTEGII